MEEIADEFEEFAMLIEIAGEKSEEGLNALKEMLSLDLDFHELHRMHALWLEAYPDLQVITRQRMLEKADEAEEFCIVYSIAPDLQKSAWEKILQIHNTSSFEEWRIQVSFSVRKNSPELERLVLCEMAKRAKTADDWATLYRDAKYGEKNPEIAKLAWGKIVKMTTTCGEWMEICHNPYVNHYKSNSWQKPLAEAKRVCQTKEDKERINEFEKWIKHM